MSLPSNWALTTLSDIRADSGSTIDPRRDPSTRFVLYSVPQFDSRMPEIVKGQEIGSSKQTVIPGTVLVCKINPRINRVWIVQDHSDGPLIASTEWIPFFPVDGINPKYLAYFLQQKEIRDYLAHNVSGVGGSLMRVRPVVVERLSFSLAPKGEQDRIVAEIEKQFTRLDDAVAALKRVQANLKRYRASVLKAACEGRLVPTEAELVRKERRSYETAGELLKRILAQRRAKWEADQLQKMITACKPPKDGTWKKKYKAPEPVETSNLPELPKGWIWTSIEAISEPKLGKMLSKAAFESELTQKPYLRNENVQWNRIDTEDVKQMGFDTDEIKRFSVQPGDLMICEGGAAGRAAIYDGPANTFQYQKALHRIRCYGGLTHTHYLQAYFAHFVPTGRVIPRRSETTIQHLPLEVLEKLPVPLPPKSEQHRIIEELARIASLADNQSNSIEVGIIRALKLRESILRNAFSGQLVSQDPNDEPASVLLERIRVERAAMATTNGNQKATTNTETNNGQRRRRVAKLAQRGSAGKGLKKR
jgi:type I restriction enzyme S subunit